MPIEAEDGCIVITGKAIDFARLLVLKGALNLQMKGIQVNRGRKPSVIIREEFGWTDRSLASLLAKLEDHIEAERQRGAHLE